MASKKSNVTGTGTPAKKPRAKTARTADPVPPHPIEGVLDINKDGQLCLRVGNDYRSLSTLAKEDGATLTLVIDLKKREGTVSANTATVLNALDAFLRLRAMGNIAGTATCCHSDD